jgi:hypothetical protein
MAHGDAVGHGSVIKCAEGVCRAPLDADDLRDIVRDYALETLPLTAPFW